MLFVSVFSLVASILAATETTGCSGLDPNCAVYNIQGLGMKDYILGNPVPCYNGTTHCSNKTQTGFDYEICLEGVFVAKNCQCPNATCRPGGMNNQCDDLSLLQQ